MNNIKKIMQERGIKNIPALAERSMIKRDQLYRFSKGDMPTLRTAQRIAAALEATVDEVWPLQFKMNHELGHVLVVRNRG